MTSASTIPSTTGSALVKSLRLSFSALGAAALALASIPQVNAKPVQVAQGSADDLGVMSISLKDVVKPQVGVQGQTQAAGTPNQAGLGGFLELDWFFWTGPIVNL